MEKLNVIQLKNELVDNIGDYGDRFSDYSDGYICDLISEISDSSVDIYNSDLWEWAKNNEEYIEQVIQEGLYAIDSNSFDLMKLFQVGQYSQIQEELYENLDNSILNFIYSNLEVEEISEEINDFIIDLCTNVDNNELIENILYEVEEKYKKK